MTIHRKVLINLPLNGPGSFNTPVSTRVLAQSSSAAANYQADCFSALPFTAVSGFTGLGPYNDYAAYTGSTDLFIIYAAYLTTATAITGTGAGGAGATANVLLWSAAGASLGTLFTLAFNTGTNTVAGVALTLGSITAPSGRSAGNGVLIRSTESIRFQWLQGGTGLALPESLISLDIV